MAASVRSVVSLTALSAVFLGVVAACMTSPNNYDWLESYDEPVAFSGYAGSAGAVVTIEALNQQTGEWEVVTTTTAATTPTLPANTVKDNPDLYGWSVTASVAQADQPATFCRWGASCARPPDPDTCEFVVRAQVRARAGSLNLITFEQGWQECFNEQIEDKSFVQAAISCQSDESPVVELIYGHIC